MKKRILVYTLVFLVGGLFGASVTSRPEGSYTDRQVERLVEIDDQAFTVASDGFGYCADVLDGLIYNDLQSVDVANKNLRSTLENINEISDERHVLLKEMGIE